MKKVCCWTTSSSRANFDPIQYPYDLLSHCSIMAMVWPSVSVSGLSPGTAFDLKSCPAVCGGGMGSCVVVVCNLHVAAVPRLCRSLRSFSHCSYFFLVLPASDVASGSASSISWMARRLPSLSASSSHTDTNSADFFADVATVKVEYGCADLAKSLM